MEIAYFVGRELDAEAVAELYRRAGLKRPTEDVPRIAAMLAHANLIVSAWDGERLVGVSRSLTDWVYCCYLADLAVDAEYQRRGIGKELIRRTQETVGDQTMILLLAAPDAMPYYPHVGFLPVENGWTIPADDEKLSQNLKSEQNSPETFRTFNDISEAWYTENTMLAEHFYAF